ncbi:FG-GAP-like repeat-containing protein [Arthrobacter sp. PsM3]|uniref:FG-GAP-like repeat-containing protein n=1 Tax=Arthrobacter sp. PsM3 TaxID=3030531 RepID=UPI00263BCB93|nr:FG-GAP-like repeat-containing protein [Arthrobacter sp. PsM3]MDN4645674.1 FG-GAP-like repeat-containing protein [Arthrobacter sp. PsM3]
MTRIRTRSRTSFALGRTKLVTTLVAVGAMAAALLSPTAAYAAVDNPVATPLVSFTFDDSQLSALTQAAPVLQKYGLTGTSYVISNCVGMTTVPNTCRSNTDVPYMTWDQITQLQNTYGWEIGSHTVDHQCLVSVGNDCQAAKLTAAQVDAELADSKAALAAHGFNATAFAPPYGDYDPSALAQVAKYYSSMRGFADTGNNIWPLGDLLLRDVPVQEVTTPVATLKAKVDEAIANKTWAVFTFHDIRPAPSQVPDDYQYGTAELDQLAAYVQTKVAAGQIKNVNISKGLVNGSPNKLANPTFNNGIGDGWRTDSPSTITADAANNGSYPDSAKSVKMVSGATAGHLFSPTVPVSPTTSYVYKTFLNVAAITTGEVGFYVDEYNAAGQWISGQFRLRENTRWVESMNFTYTPSSANVASASLQISVTGTGITAYVDNAQMLALGAETTPPPAPGASKRLNDFNGDAKTDLIARDASGELWLYPGTGTGDWLKRIDLGAGWNVMSTIVSAGDFNADGKADVIARDKSGELWFYPGTGTGDWSTRQNLGAGWNVMTSIVAPGDFNGDGKPDVIARDSSGELWLYPNNGAGDWFKRVDLGSGWNIMSSIAAPGDFNNDGNVDLVARDTSGEFWLYPGNGKNEWLKRVDLGAGWNTMNAITAPGDMNSDGRPDVIARDSTGELWLYPNNGTGDWFKRIDLGSGWGPMTAIL